FDDLQQRESDQAIADHHTKDASALQLGDEVFDGQRVPRERGVYHDSGSTFGNQVCGNSQRRWLLDRCYCECEACSSSSRKTGAQSCHLTSTGAGNRRARVEEVGRSGIIRWVRIDVPPVSLENRLRKVILDAARKLRVKQDGIAGVSHHVVEQVSVGRLRYSAGYGHRTYPKPVGNRVAGVAKDCILIRYRSGSWRRRVVVDADAVSGAPGDPSSGGEVAIDFVERIRL